MKQYGVSILPFVPALLCLILTAMLNIPVSEQTVKKKERVYYLDLEHINITYWNPKYYAYMNSSACRYSRRDPLHYVNMHFETLAPLGNNFTVSIYVYEFLSNEYRRSFVEMHYAICDLFNDNIIGQFINRQPYKTCPFPKGVYHLVNMSIPDLPLLSTFPFQKGRLYINATLVNTGRRVERMTEWFVDGTIKTRWR